MERRVKDEVKIILFSVLLLLFITGCTINITTTLHEDGSGQTSALISDSQENMAFLRSAPGMSGYLHSIIRQIKSLGMKLDRFSEGGNEYIFIQRNLNYINSNTINSAFSSSWIYVDKYKDDNEIVLRFTGLIDARKLYPDSNNLDTVITNELTNQISRIDMTYRLYAPGKIVYHNGDELLNNGILWKIKMDQVNYLVAEVRIPHNDNEGIDLLYIFIGLAVTFLLSTIILIFSSYIKPTVH
ncbi:MAG: hypothetical protein ACOY16_00965 [Chloroflexota bacterium]